MRACEGSCCRATFTLRAAMLLLLLLLHMPAGEPADGPQQLLLVQLAVCPVDEGCERRHMLWRRMRLH
jgi:hypothetical protein